MVRRLHAAALAIVLIAAGLDAPAKSSDTERLARKAAKRIGHNTRVLRLDPSLVEKSVGIQLTLDARTHVEVEFKSREDIHHNAIWIGQTNDGDEVVFTRSGIRKVVGTFNYIGKSYLLLPVVSQGHYLLIEDPREDLESVLDSLKHVDRSDFDRHKQVIALSKQDDFTKEYFESSPTTGVVRRIRTPDLGTIVDNKVVFNDTAKDIFMLSGDEDLRITRTRTRKHLTTIFVMQYINDLRLFKRSVVTVDERVGKIVLVTSRIKPSRGDYPIPDGDTLTERAAKFKAIEAFKAHDGTKLGLGSYVKEAELGYDNVGPELVLEWRFRIGRAIVRVNASTGETKVIALATR
ncbi:MAG: hypothetical protein AAF525_10220 [Pseudomonadota bacterium]